MRGVLTLVRVRRRLFTRPLAVTSATSAASKGLFRALRKASLSCLSGSGFFFSGISHSVKATMPGFEVRGIAEIERQGRRVQAALFDIGIMALDAVLIEKAGQGRRQCR